jgi:hypothetical protein
LFALSKYDESLRQLRAAAERPGARFDLKLEDGIAMVIPHLNKLRGIAQFLQLRSIALLHDGQNDAALQDFLLLVRINYAIAAEPTLISQLGRISVSHISLRDTLGGIGGTLLG